MHFTCHETPFLTVINIYVSKRGFSYKYFIIP